MRNEKMRDGKKRDEKMRDENMHDEKMRTKKCPTKKCLTKICPVTVSNPLPPGCKTGTIALVHVTDSSYSKHIPWNFSRCDQRPQC